MDLSFLFYLSSGLFLGWSLGASEASNFGTAVATKMIKFRTASIVASICIILGAVYAGAGASQTLSSLGNITVLAGAFMVALSAALAAAWMVRLSIPVSVSQAIVGGILGWNLYAGHNVDWVILSQIISAWFLGPVFSGVIAILLYSGLRFLFKHWSVHLLRKDCYTRIALLLAGAFGSYALGANNIANVMGVFVLSSPVHQLELPLGIILNKAQVLFLLGGLAIATGIITYSQKVIFTVGHRIMQLSPLMAWVVVASQGLVLFLFSSQKLQEFLLCHNLPALPLVPVSSTQAVIGAVIGLGIMKSGHNLNWPILGKIGISFILTPICAALICYISLFFLQNVFNQVVY
jgi:PiT family inorganic phosphate transporter